MTSCASLAAIVPVEADATSHRAPRGVEVALHALLSCEVREVRAELQLVPVRSEARDLESFLLFFYQFHLIQFQSIFLV